MSQPSNETLDVVLPRPGQTPNPDESGIVGPSEEFFRSTFGNLLPPVEYLGTADGRAAYYSIPPEDPKEDTHVSPERVLFIHGVQTPALGMIPLARALKTSFPGSHFVLLDLWGHALSETPRVPHNADLFHRLIDSLLDHLKWPSAHFIGFSFGGSLTVGYAASRAARVQSYTLVAPAGLIRSSSFTADEQNHFQPGCDEAAARDWIIGFLEGGKLEVPADWKDHVKEGKVVAEAVREWQTRAHAGHTASVVAIFRDGGVMDNHENFKKAVATGIPSLVVLGETDELYNEQEIRDLGFKDVHVVPKAGHGVVRERVPEVAGFITDFWSNVRGNGKRKWKEERFETFEETSVLPQDNDVWKVAVAIETKKVEPAEQFSTLESSDEDEIPAVEGGLPRQCPVRREVSSRNYLSQLAYMHTCGAILVQPSPHLKTLHRWSFDNLRTTHDNTAMSHLPSSPPTGIHVLIVGAGFAGISLAIECTRKGHKASVLEKASNVEEITRYGDIISFDPNGARNFARWPGVLEAMRKVARKTTWLDFYHWKGEFVTRQSFEGEKEWGPRINGHRGELYQIMHDHAVGLGIEIKWGQRVTDYFEDAEKAGVVVNGKEMAADIVVAAEGVRSRGRKIVLGFDDKPKSSGYAVYRCWFKGNAIKDNPMLKHLVDGDQHLGFIGPDLHFLASSLKGGKEFNWVFTHVDDGNIEESWQFPGRVQDCLKYVEGWAPMVQEIVRSTPKDARLIDHKLVFRDPLPTFISPKHRIALIGDAAHPFLPSSIQGASQSIEDGVVLAACLELAGKANIPLAVRAFEKLRYERVHRAQATGVKTRERWHKANWDEIAKKPESIHLAREAWLLNFDAEKDCYDRFYEVARELRGRQARL
ncbi:FAD/NAD(P)-binding domain-containing protein [Stemphylium lycopersici]|nr:FAD/NAD(P)-binding domain-containing protein [Stemphylium lycopersici]